MDNLNKEIKDLVTKIFVDSPTSTSNLFFFSIFLFLDIFSTIKRLFIKDKK